jgi:hypothetical protein
LDEGRYAPVGQERERLGDVTPHPGRFEECLVAPVLELDQLLPEQTRVPLDGAGLVELQDDAAPAPVGVVDEARHAFADLRDETCVADGRQLEPAGAVAVVVLPTAAMQRLSHRPRSTCPRTRA